MKIDEFDDDYYVWRTEAVSINRNIFRIRSKPGVPGFGQPDVPQILLAESLELGNTDTVLNLNCGSGLVGTVAGTLAPHSKVVMTDANYVAVQAALSTASLNAMGNLNVYHSSGLGDVGNIITADVATVRIPKGKLPSLQLILDAYVSLKEGGRFYISGGNDEGIKSYISHAEALFGQRIYPIAYRKGCRVGMVVKKNELPALPEAFQNEWLRHNNYRHLTLNSRGVTFRVCSRPGVFSWDRLDEGTRQLLDVMSIGPRDSVLDLGCGYGILGLAAAKLAPDVLVTLIDADINALNASRCTAGINAIANYQVLASDVTSAVSDQEFDVVLANLPFHLAHRTDYGIAKQFVWGAFSVLRPNGRCLLVANRFLPYEGIIQNVFGNVVVVQESRQYKVLSATRNRGR